MSLIDLLGLGAVAGVRAKSAKVEGEREREAFEHDRLLEKLKYEQDAADRALRQRLMDAQIQNYESLTAGRGQSAVSGGETFGVTPVQVIGPDGQPQLVRFGNRGGMRVEEGLVKPEAERAPRRQVVGGAIVDLDSGTARPIEGLPAGGSERVAASTRAQLADNAVQLDLVRRARDAVRRRPESVGMKFATGTLPGMGQVGEMVNQRIDPEGAEVRQLIAQVSARKIKDLSGAAVTVSEFPRLAAFVPLVWDTPEKIEANLAALERELQVVMQALENGVSLEELMGNAPSPARRAAAPTASAPQAAPPDFEAWRASRRQP